MERLGAIALAALLLVSCAVPPAAVRTDRVRIFDDPSKPQTAWGYDPARIEVSKGTAVTFTNSGTVFHTVTDDGKTGARTFDAGVDPGAMAKITFDTPGTWSYHCGVHPDMKGSVVVCDGKCGG